MGEKNYNGKPFIGLEAYCEKRKEIRVFRIDRILEMKLPESSFAMKSYIEVKS